MQTYSQRALTKRTDVFDAISAILTSLYGQTGHLFGLSKQSFDEALLWSASIALVSNPDGRLFQSEERVIPTWSWGSVVSTVYEMEEKLYESLVKWSFLDGSNMEPLEAIEDPRTWGEPNALARIYLMIAWSEGCIESKKDLLSWASTPFEQLDMTLRACWHSYEAFHHEAFEVESSSHPQLPTFHPPQGPLHVTEGLLGVQAQSAHFRLSWPPSDSSYKAWISILNRSDKFAGYVYSREVSFQEDETLDLLCNRRDYEWEFIALSVGGLSQYKYRAIESSGLAFDLEKNKYHSSSGESLVPMVNVMMIMREGGVTRRVTVGQIFLSEWSQASRSLSHIWLR